MFAACHLTCFDHGGGSAEEVTPSHFGSPDRLFESLDTSNIKIQGKICLPD